MENIIREYLDHLRSGNTEKITQLFSGEAVVHSPLYGSVLAKHFFRRLFEDTIQSDITLLNIFRSIDKEDLYTAHFRYRWVLKNGAVTTFECMNVMQFNDQSEIKDMTIIYDSDKSRHGYETLD